MYIYNYERKSRTNEFLGRQKNDSTEKQKNWTKKFFFLWYKARMDPMCSFYVQTTSARSETGTPTKHSSTIHTPGMGGYNFIFHIQWQVASVWKDRMLFEGIRREMVSLSFSLCVYVCVYGSVSVRVRAREKWRISYGSVCLGVFDMFDCWQFGSGFSLLSWHAWVCVCEFANIHWWAFLCVRGLWREKI